MFRRQKKTNEQNDLNPDNEIRKEQEAEEALLNIGNEAAGRMGGFLNPVSNEANNSIDGSDDTLKHYAENDLNNYTLFTGRKHRKKNIPPEIIKEGLTDYYENDLNNLTLNKPKGNNINTEKAPDDINGPAGKGMEEKDLSEDLIENDLPELIGPLMKGDADSLSSRISDNGSSPKQKEKKRSKSPKNSKKSSDGKAAVPQEEDRDLTMADESMEPAQGWDFVAEKLPARKKQKFLSKLASWAAYYSGKTIGRIGGIFATIGKSIWDLFRPGPGTLRGTFNRLRGSGRFQKQGDREIIPGWDGARFEKEAVSENDVELDFRRVPEIWSYPTAAKAAEGDATQRDAKPVNPVISVYISPSSDEYTAGENTSTGHSGVGIEFSRYSALSGRWQRYNLRFGYFTKGGLPLKEKFAVTGANNATIPGQLANEKGKHYKVSRSWSIRPKQVSDVLRAAESFADRGGYNAYTRNCTTFAKEMIVDAAKIKSAAGVFAKDEVYLHKKADAKMFAAGAFAPLAKAGVENGFEKIGQKDDLSYQNFGNKMVSKEDHARYRESVKFLSFRSTEADSPNAVAANLMRSEGGRSGSIGRFTGINLDGRAYDAAPLSLTVKRIIPLALDLKTRLTSITPPDRFTEAGEFSQLVEDLDGNRIFAQVSAIIPVHDDTVMKERAKQSDLMKVHTLFSDKIKKLNTLLFKYYRNDKRVQEIVLPYINLLNHGINAVNDAYAANGEKDLTGADSDLRKLTDEFGRKEYSFTNNGKTSTLTASQYEAWLQVCKTPQAALEKYYRYGLLKNKCQSHSATPEEKKELQTLSRVKDLALDFERSHRYMMNREKYSQQDVDYAFSLEKKERQGDFSSDMFEQNWNDPTMATMKNPNASASATYQMLIMKGVFGGMKDRFTKKFEKGCEPKDMPGWINDDILDCIRNHGEEMATIIRGMMHAADKPDKRRLQADFSSLLTRWIFELFHGEMDVNQYRTMVKTLMRRSGEIMKEVDKVITGVMGEDQPEKFPDSE